jgi:hypothetical protein
MGREKSPGSMGADKPIATWARRREWSPFALLLYAVLACTGATPVGAAHVEPHEATPNPNHQALHVSWSPKLFELFAPMAVDVKDADAPKAQLDRKWEDRFTVTNGSQTTEVTSCRSLLDLADAYEPAAPEFEIFQGRKARCRALSLVANAKPARNSLVRGFVLDDSAPARLPAGLAMNISPDDERRIAEATKRGQRWRDLEEVKLVSRTSPEEATYADETSKQNLVLLAHGDFNGDGFEDLLVLSEGRLPEGSYEATRLFVVTQTATEQQLALLPTP